MTPRLTLITNPEPLGDMSDAATCVTCGASALQALTSDAVPLSATEFVCAHCRATPDESVTSDELKLSENGLAIDALRADLANLSGAIGEHAHHMPAERVAAFRALTQQMIDEIAHSVIP